MTRTSEVFLAQEKQAVLHRIGLVAPPHANDVTCVASKKHECPSYIVFCIPWLAPRNVNDVSCVANIKHECRSSIVFCIP